MSEKSEPSSSMGSSSEGRVADADAAEDEDVYAQLAQKERDLILAAELGKALLDSNQELQSRYDQMAEEYTHKFEELQQEKYDLHLELEKMETEYQNAIKDLQDDIAVLRKQVRVTDELQVSERERSRSLREAQQNSDYLMEQVKKATLKEEELLKELDQLKIREESSSATIKDQLDHIAMLRDQVEVLSEKLQATNQNLLKLQGERDALINTLETTQESIQNLELKILQQDTKILQQTSEIEELQESNSNLMQQLRQQRQHQARAPHLNSSKIYNSSNGRHSSNSGGSSKQKSHNLYFELNQEKQKEPCFHQPTLTQPQQQKLDLLLQGQDQNSHAEKHDEFYDCSDGEQLHFSELILGSSSGKMKSMECSSLCRHSIKINDCGICYVAEGSRKRHHQNIGGSSDDDDDDHGDNGPKQSLYSKSYVSGSNLCRRAASSTMDSNGNQVSFLIPSHLDDLDSYGQDSSELTQTESSNELSHDHLPLAGSGSFAKSWLPLNTSQENLIFGDLTSQFDDSVCDEEENKKSLFSELSPFAPEFCPRYQEFQERSLFSELSSQLYEDKNGTGSDSSSSCMLGIFDFSGNDAQDVDRNSNESLNRSMEMRSRIESDMSYVSDWYYMTPMTSEMLEEDDFECDDDDFLVGNMAGTTLSISDSDHGLSHYKYHSYIPAESRSDQQHSVQGSGDASCTKVHAGKCFDEHQVKLSEACRQLRELVIRAGGDSSSSRDDDLQCSGPEETWRSSTDVLLSLVAEVRACFDKMTGEKAGELQSSDISTTVKDEEDRATSSISDLECVQKEDK